MSETSRNSFLVCTVCDGQGFLRSGDFADRVFTTCATCKGLGQMYLVPVAERLKVKT
jgi:DnaJ-class molecular chaperone